MTGRRYKTTHPWLSFELDLQKASAALWITLGEAQSKCQHIAGVPLNPSTATRMHQVFLARGLLATAAIEGNTLTEVEVRARIENKLQLPPSREYLGKEIDNILAAFNEMLEEIKAKKRVPLSSALIKTFNASVLRDLEVAPEVTPGQIRKHDVGVGTYRGAPPEDCEYLAERLCEWLNSRDFITGDGNEIIYGIIKSIIAHIYVAWIHPFGDGNGRTARMMEVKFLLEAGVPSAAAHLLSNHYNLTRNEYYRQLDYASKSNGNLLPFINYAVTGFRDQLREQIETIKQQQLYVSWVNYVHEQFGSNKSPAITRQKNVVLAMSEHDDPIKAPEIKKITPQIAIDYAGKTAKTLTRDLNRLRDMGLIEGGPDGYIANKAKMLAFLPIVISKPKTDAASVPGVELPFELVPG